MSSAAAVFSPTPATPGSPSEGSPRSVAKSAYGPRRDAVLAPAPTASVDHARGCRPRARCRAPARRASSSTSWNRSRSPVTTSTGIAAAWREGADDVVGLVAGRADAGRCRAPRARRG